ncbi:unnamed protein product [Cuscuta campestris]|uniref:Uncharacterized protein n=1 Tax=Cuscuta campestris TaxID=132261 RepID=A0A484L397_9ASTE|nr:unnamed protein product [Cuscuta campestris]
MNVPNFMGGAQEDTWNIELKCQPPHILHTSMNLTWSFEEAGGVGSAIDELFIPGKKWRKEKIFMGRREMVPCLVRTRNYHLALDKGGCLFQPLNGSDV